MNHPSSIGFHVLKGPTPTGVGGGLHTVFRYDGQGIELETAEVSPGQWLASLRAALNPWGPRNWAPEATPPAAFQGAVVGWQAANLPAVNWVRIEQNLSAIKAI